MSGTRIEQPSARKTWWRGLGFGLVTGVVTFLIPQISEYLEAWRKGLLSVGVFFFTWGVERLFFGDRHRGWGAVFLVAGVVTTVVAVVPWPDSRVIPDPNDPNQTVDPATASATATGWVTSTRVPSVSASTGPSIAVSTTQATGSGRPWRGADDSSDREPVEDPGAITAPEEPRAEVDTGADRQEGPQPPVYGVLFDNYSAAVQPGIPMCLGNSSRPESLPGGVITQVFTVPADATSLDGAMVQIDPNSAATATATLSGPAGSTTAMATPAGDTLFTFSPLTVTGNSQITLTIKFSSTQGKLITVYKTGSPGGSFRVENSCSDGAPTMHLSPYGLRATISGWSG